MSLRRQEPAPDGDPAEGAAASAPGPASHKPPASGVVRRDDLEAELSGAAPPWVVVHAYLARGEHRSWVEAHALRSRAFADVLAALRNDHEERLEQRGVVLSFSGGSGRGTRRGEK